MFDSIKQNHLNKRASGVLFHITSLPANYGIGDLGKEAYRFIDFLSHTKQSYWQVLPLNPTRPVLGNSPYSSPSGFAGNPSLISPDLLLEEGALSHSDLKFFPPFSDNKIEYKAVLSFKDHLLQKAFKNCETNLVSDREFKLFCSQNSFWLEDYSLFISLKEVYGNISWNTFPADLSDRSYNAMELYKEKLDKRILAEKFYQYLFFKQWFSLKKYCNERGIKIIGDIPYYVNYDSSDVWSNQLIFKLNENKASVYVSGVPPDYFSKTGQLWGNPVYNWDKLKETDYNWWIKRLEHNLKLFDILRLDHFRGLVSYWEIPAEEKTAVNGKWVNVPTEDFFTKVINHLKELRFIAEDLGTITPDVIEWRKKLKLPGMKILQFAFGDDFPNGSYLPHNHTNSSIVYTGTHDNNTTKGWWENEATLEEKNRVKEYVKHPFHDDNINWEFIKMAMNSSANTAILPMQDILGLGAEARMNTPSTNYGNWVWKLSKDFIGDEVKEILKEITESSSRC